MRIAIDTFRQGKRREAHYAEWDRARGSHPTGLGRRSTWHRRAVSTGSSFETIGERTLAFGHRDRLLNPERGYNPQLAARMRGVLGACRDNQTRIMTNMGVANVEKAAEVVVGVARDLGLEGLKVAAVLGDEVTDQFDDKTALTDEEGLTIGDVGGRLLALTPISGSMRSCRRSRPERTWSSPARSRTRRCFWRRSLLNTAGRVTTGAQLGQGTHGRAT